MAQRNQLRRALGALDRRDARDAEHIALLRISGLAPRPVSTAASRCARLPRPRDVSPACPRHRPCGLVRRRQSGSRASSASSNPARERNTRLDIIRRQASLRPSVFRAHRSLRPCPAGGLRAQRSHGAAGARAGVRPADAGRGRQRGTAARPGAQARRADHGPDPARPGLPGRPGVDGVPEPPRLPTRFSQRGAHERLQLLHRARSDAQRLRAARRIHRCPYRSGHRRPDGVRAGGRDRARNRPRVAASHRAHARTAEGHHGDPDRRAAAGNSRGARRRIVERRPGAGGDHGRPGGGNTAAAQLLARGRARGRSRRLRHPGECRFRRTRTGSASSAVCSRVRACTRAPRRSTCGRTR